MAYRREKRKREIREDDNDALVTGKSDRSTKPYIGYPLTRLRDDHSLNDFSWTNDAEKAEKTSEHFFKHYI